MQRDKIKILSTRPLDASLVEEALGTGIVIDEIPFIETNPVQNDETVSAVQKAALLPIHVVFTSMNAVESVAGMLGILRPSWKIYCTGNTTFRLTREYFGENSIAGTAGNAAELAERITGETGDKEVIFFCGDRRRDELPGILKRKGFNVVEIEVYKTILVPKPVHRQYDGILFFSPSAVESFFSINQPSEQTVLFAIGKTTADAIGQFSFNKLVTGKEPGKESLVEEVKTYFLNAINSETR